MVQERQLTELHQAVLSGDLEEVQALLAAGAVDLEATTAPTGYTPLLYAARRGLIELLPSLVAAGANHRATTVRGSTALHLAAASQHAPTVAYLAGLPGTDLLATNRRNETALDIAAAKRQQGVSDLPVMPVVRALLDALVASAADAKAIQEAAGAAAQQACNAGNPKVASLLLKIAGPAAASLSLQEAREHDNEEVAFDAVIAAWQHEWHKCHDVRVLQEERRQLEREQRELAEARRSFQGLICQAAAVIRHAQQTSAQQSQTPQQPGGPAPPEHAADAAAAADVGKSKKRKKRKQGSSDAQQQQQPGAASPIKKQKRQKKLRAVEAS